MTAVSNSTSAESVNSTTAQWEAVGAWHGGNVVAVALADGQDATVGLLASAAGAYRWQQPGGKVAPAPVGLNDLNLFAVAIAGGVDAPPTAFAATSTGRLFTARLAAGRDSAPEWQEVSAWAGLGTAVVLAPSPAFDHDQTLFVGTPAGFYRTQDGGQSWESCNFGLLDEDALCMVCAPNFAESEILWAGTAGGGLYRSRNSARAWRESGLGLPDAAVQALAVSPNFSTDQTLLAGMEGNGIYISRDGGANWSPFALAGQSVNTLAWAHAEWIWAGTEDGMWRIASANGAAEQVAAAGAAVMSVAATAQGRVALGLYGGGLWLTDDGHAAAGALVWQQPELALHAPPVVTSVDETLFALDLDGEIGYSVDGGAQWTMTEHAALGMAFALDSARSTAADGTPGITVYAASETGFIRWDAARQSWEPVEGASQDVGWGVVLSPRFADDHTLLALGPNQALRLSQDGGTTWRDISGAISNEALLQARIGPDGDGALLALTARETEPGSFALTLWDSADFGENWEVLAGLSSGVAAAHLAWPHDTTEKAIFLATQHRVIKFFYQGNPPTLQLHQHLFDEGVRVTALAAAADYVQSGIVWAATSAGLYRSVDRGLTWALMLDLPLDLPVVWLQVAPTHITAITLGGNVWRAAL